MFINFKPLIADLIFLEFKASILGGTGLRIEKFMPASAPINAHVGIIALNFGAEKFKERIITRKNFFFAGLFVLSCELGNQNSLCREKRVLIKIIGIEIHALIIRPNSPVIDIPTFADQVFPLKAHFARDIGNVSNQPQTI